jgi:hypothetical protein
MTTPASGPRYVCKHCGNLVGFWFYGWKHQRGWHSKAPTCGRRLTKDDITIKGKENEQRQA